MRTRGRSPRALVLVVAALVLLLGLGSAVAAAAPKGDRGARRGSIADDEISIQLRSTWARADSRQGFAEATNRPALEILDRVGGGDSFAAGLLYGVLELDDLDLAVEYGAARGALAMTTPGDPSMATLREVERLVAGVGARVQR
jgi:sugar/nucleoside kinase (ribokinase family)